MTVWGERFGAVLCASIAAYMMYGAWEFPAGGNQFPIFACSAVIVISIMMVIRSFVSPQMFTGTLSTSISFADLKPLLLTAATVGYVFLIFRLGYYTSSALFLIVICLAVGVRNYKALALTTVITFPLMYAFFELFLQAQMPRGILI